MSNDIKSGDDIGIIVIKLQNRISELEKKFPKNINLYSLYEQNTLDQFKVEIAELEKKCKDESNTNEQKEQELRDEIAELERKHNEFYSLYLERIAQLQTTLNELKEDYKNEYMTTTYLVNDYNMLKEDMEACGVNIGTIDDAIDELKERNVYYHHEIRSMYDRLEVEIIPIKEVLREYFKELHSYIDHKNSNKFDKKIIKLLEKLEGKKVNHFKEWIKENPVWEDSGDDSVGVKEECEHQYTQYHLTTGKLSCQLCGQSMKDSGDEKSVGSNTAVSIPLRSSLGELQYKTDSKPPEVDLCYYSSNCPFRKADIAEFVESIRPIIHDSSDGSARHDLAKVLRKWEEKLK